MLPATPHVEAVVTGAGGVLDSMGEGGVVLDMSTIAPTGTDRVAKACAEKGVARLPRKTRRIAVHGRL
jgi:4-hydroxybutyrate dehydrogenase/sulfolactaldehyde 3-reductase